MLCAFAYLGWNKIHYKQKARVNGKSRFVHLAEYKLIMEKQETRKIMAKSAIKPHVRKSNSAKSHNKTEKIGSNLQVRHKYATNINECMYVAVAF